MLTYDLKKAPGVPLYEALYRCIRSDILSGRLAAGEKLPSKRALSQNLEVSKITVETAYQQLLAEGYIRSREKVGYFVEAVEHGSQQPLQWQAPEAEAERVAQILKQEMENACKLNVPLVVDMNTGKSWYDTK